MQQQLEHDYHVYGLVAEMPHTGHFSGSALLSSGGGGMGGMGGGWFDVSTTHLNLTINPGAPGTSDETEATDGVPASISLSGSTTFPSPLPPGAVGNPIWLTLTNNNEPGELSFSVSGGGAAVYRYDPMLGESHEVTSPIPWPGGDLVETFDLITNDNFSGDVTVEARFEHDDGATDAADLVKVWPYTPIQINPQDSILVSWENDGDNDPFDGVIYAQSSVLRGSMSAQPSYLQPTSSNRE